MYQSVTTELCIIKINVCLITCFEEIMLQTIK